MIHHACRTALVAVVVILFATAAMAGNFTLSPTAQLVGTHDWTQPLNWLENGLPTLTYPGQNAGDAVTVSGLAGVTVYVGDSIPNAVTLSVATATVNITSGGSLSLTGTSGVTSGGTLKVSGGTLANAGTLNFAGGTEFRWADGIVEGSGTTKVNIFTTTGARAFIEGSGSATLNGQTLEVAGGQLTYKNGGMLDLTNGANITVTAGSMEAQSAGTWSSSDATGSVKIGGSTSFTIPVTMVSTVRIEAQVINDGGIYVDNGNLELAGGGAHTGVFQSTNVGSTVAFDGGTHILTGVSLTGAGYARVESGSVSLAGTVASTVNRFRLRGGSITGSGALNVSSIFEWEGGAINGTGGAVTLSNGAELRGGTSGMTLNGRQLALTGGTMQYDASNPLRMENNAELVVETGAILELEYDQPIDSDGTAKITNRGEIIRVGSVIAHAPRPRRITVNPASTATIYAAVHTSGGAIRSYGGYLGIAGGGTHNNATFEPSTVADTIDFSGGTHTLTGTFALPGAGPLTLSAGTLTTNTSVVIPTAATFVQNGGTLNGTADVMNNGAFYWNGGDHDGSARVVNNRAFYLAGTTGTMRLKSSRQLVNAKDLYFTSATNPLEINDAALLENRDQFIISVDGSITTAGGTTRRIDNTGSLVRSAGSGIFRIWVPLNLSASGRAVVDAGYLELTGGGTSTGTSVGFDLTGIATKVRIAGGTYNLGPGTSVTMSGASSLFFVDGGIANFTANLSIPRVYLHTGSIDGSGTLTVTETLTWTGGAMNGSGTTLIDTGATLDASSQNARSAMTRTIRNRGTFSLDPTVSLTLTAAAIQNEGTFNLSGDGAIASGATAGSINNQGLMRKINGTANLGTRIDVPLTNAAGATLSSQIANTNLILNGGGSNSGTLDFGTALATIDIFGGTFTYNGGAVTGDGIVRVNGTGTLQLGANLTVPQFELQPGGTLDGTANLTIANSGRWSGGTMRGGATSVIIPATATLSIDGNAAMTLDGRTLNNAGTINFVPASANLTMTNNASIVNSGVYQATAGRNIDVTGSATFTNSGTFVRNGSGTAHIAPPFTNSGIVTIDAGMLSFGNYVQTAGEITLAGGSLTTAGPFNLNGGSLRGAGTITGSVSSNGGTVAPGDVATTGTLHLTGAFAQGSGSTLAIRLGTTPDQLDVADDVLLGGTLDVSLMPAFTPTNGSTYDVLLFGGTRTADFATKTLPTFPPDGTFSAAYLTNALQLTAAVTPQANVGITISAPTSQQAGQNLTYTITVTNLGPDVASSVTVNATTAAGLTFVANSGDCTSAFPCNLGSIPSGQSRTISAQYTIAAGTPAATILTTSATVTSTSTDSDSTNDSAAASTTVTTASADLSIVKTGPSFIGAGQSLTYSLTITNNGPDAATSVVVSDATPANTTFVSTSGDCTTAFPCALGTLASGTSKTITATYLVGAATPGGTVISNSASVTSTTADSNAANNTTPPVTTTVTVPNANLAITKSGPATAGAGTNVTYTVTVTNLGPDAASSVIVTDPTPANLTFVSNTGDCTTAFPCTIASLAPSQSKTITATYTVNAATPAATVITNSASVTSSTVDPDGSNDSASTSLTVTVPNANLAIAKSGPATIGAGQHLFYTLTVTNNGPDAATGVLVHDATPAGVTFVLNSGDCTSAFPCSLGTLTSGQSKTITAKFSVPAGTTAGTVITNNASVTSSTADPASADNSASATTTVTAPVADLRITKSGPSSIQSGEQLVYTIDVKNLGPDAASNVIVTDATPAGVTFVEATGVCTSFPCTIPSIAAGQTKTIAAKYAVPASATTGTVITNTASVTSSSTDTDASNDSATVATTVTQKADLVLTKSAPASAEEGDTILYTIQVANAGPGDALNVIVSDPTPAGLTFAGNSGDCTTAFPCNLGTLTPGSTKTISAQYVVGSATSITNTATVTTTSVDPDLASNTAVATTTVGSTPECPAFGPALVSPAAGSTNAQASGQLSWSHTAEASYTVFLGPEGSGCTASPFASTDLTSIAYTNLQPGKTYEWRVEASSGSCPTVTSSCIKFTVGAGCNNAPSLLAPLGGTQSSPVKFSWSAVGGATGYQLKVFSRGAQVVDRTTTETSVEELIPDGNATWFVSALYANCPAAPSATGTFTVCNEGLSVIPRVVGQATSGQSYAVEWDEALNASRYEIDEADNPEFTNASTFSVNGNPSKHFTHVVNDAAKAFYYRVRAVSGCKGTIGPNSVTIRVVIVPIVKSEQNPGANVPAGSDRIVVQHLFVPGEPGLTLLYQASVDRPWLSVSPAAGTLPPDGVTLEVSADPTGLPNGTFSGTVIITTTLQNGTRLSTNDTPRSSTVSVSLVTPIRPVLAKGATPDNALIIPSVGHLDGANSRWQSDIRITNTFEQGMRYLLTFTPAGAQPKSTTVEVAPGATIALDDIVRNWYGIGSLGDSANGLLEIRSAEAQNPNQPMSRVAVASSRTYNVTKSGTLGQYIPAIPFSSFIGRVADGAALPQLLSLQQIAQSDAYRTNLGLVEASGQPASVLVNVFNGAGERVLQLPLELKGGEQRQLNSFLAEHKIALTDGRIEVQVTGGNGRVTAYASVVDNKTNDPLLVSGVPLGGTATTNRWILPGVASVNNALASWRTDMRIFNSGVEPQTATLTFWPQGHAPVRADVTLQPGEVRTFDDAVTTFFKEQDTGGAVHVETPTNANLVVSGRTYNQTPDGTYGQFIPAVTAADSVGVTDGRSLHILQVEDSDRYRTNLGLVEVTGKEATVEVRVVLPDSRVSPTVRLKLDGNQFHQFRILSEMGLANVYNARLSVRVVEGEGRVAAYGSVIDMRTQDPTYVPAQ
ncbi:MAG TPA: hypothetical protein VF618_28560 [Thermoanaerobaculia bacterium]